MSNHSSQPPKSKEVRTALSQQIELSWRGPLPPPEVLDAYERISPGAPKVILEMAVNQQQHRLRLESADLGHRIFMERAGLFGGFVLVCWELRS